MGMSTHVIGVRDLDGQFAKMIAAKIACEKAGIGYPQEITDYFLYPESSEECLRREMENIDIEIAVTEYGRAGTDGFEVDLSQLADNVKAIRFENSY